LVRSSKPINAKPKKVLRSPKRTLTVSTQNIPTTTTPFKTTLTLNPPLSPVTQQHKHFASDGLNRSNLKPLAQSVTTLDQLDNLHSKGKILSAAELSKRSQQATQEHQKKVDLQTKHAKDGQLQAGQEASNAQIEAQLDEINQAAHITPPAQNITRHLHSPHFLPMWDPQFRSNSDLVTSFETSTGLKLADMDLYGVNVNIPETIGLRQRLQQQNKVSLVFITSTDASHEYASICAQLWSKEFSKHGESNQDGAIIVQPTLIQISEGFLSGLFIKSINQNISKSLPTSLRPNAFSYHIKSTDGPVARARRFLDCRNRYVANLFLVDERGLIRWKSRIGTVPTKEFMQILYNVTNDLILETKFDEAD
jgi:hypothetical protein